MRQDVLNLLDDLAANERGRITSAEVRERLGISEQSTSNLMKRLVDAGLLDRVARGAYAPRPLGELGTRAASHDIALAVAAAFAAEPPERHAIIPASMATKTIRTSRRGWSGSSRSAAA